jgi:hypothetical protein
MDDREVLLALLALVIVDKHDGVVLLDRDLGRLFIENIYSVRLHVEDNGEGPMVVRISYTGHEFEKPNPLRQQPTEADKAMFKSIGIRL